MGSLILGEITCPVCNCSFVPGKEEREEGDCRCTSCLANNITVEDKMNPSEKDALVSDRNRMENLKSMVRDVIKEVLKEREEEKITRKFRPKTCKECAKEFVPRAPAQKICQDCIDTKK